MIALMICARLHVQIRPLGNIRDFPTPRWVGIVSVLILAGYFLGQKCGKL